MGSTHLAVSMDTFSTLTLACMDCECFAAVRDVSFLEMPRETLVLSLFTTCLCSALIDENLTMYFLGGVAAVAADSVAAVAAEAEAVRRTALAERSSGAATVSEQRLQDLCRGGKKHNM